MAAQAVHPWRSPGKVFRRRRQRVILWSADVNSLQVRSSDGLVAHSRRLLLVSGLHNKAWDCLTEQQQGPCRSSSSAWALPNMSPAYALTLSQHDLKTSHCICEARDAWPLTCLGDEATHAA